MKFSIRLTLAEYSTVKPSAAYEETFLGSFVEAKDYGEALVAVAIALLPEGEPIFLNVTEEDNPTNPSFLAGRYNTEEDAPLLPKSFAFFRA